MFGGGPHRELIAVRFADDDGTGALEALDNRRAVGRNVMLEDSGPRRRPQAARADVVFYSDRNAEERQVVGPGRSAIERRRATESSLVVDGDERVERR